MEQHYYTIFEIERKLLYLDPAHFEHYLAEQFYEINERGVMLTKSKCIAALPFAKSTTLLFIISNFKTIELSPTMIQTSYKTTHVETKEPLMRSSIWQQVDGSWQLIFHQKTIIK